MDNNLKGLVLPSERRISFWLVAGSIAFAVSGAAALIYPAVGLPYLVTAILFLPLLLPLLVSPRVQRWEATLGRLGHLALVAAVFLYLALAHSVVAPIVLAELGYAAA